jgi:UDPglucose 6-dehydrogenase
MYVMRLSVIGTGYVGLVAGACFADSGNDVICVDIDADKVRRLSEGEVPIYEPGLNPIVERNLREKRLHFTTDVADAVRRTNIIFLAVGTPEGQDGHADLSQVEGAARSIGQAMDGPKIIVIKSTVPLNTAERVSAIIESLSPHSFEIVSNPEFLKEGTAVEDFVRPDRIVIGTESAKAREVMGELYSPFVRTHNPILFMDRRSAELTKYASNAMLALRISFMNEMSRLAEVIGADIDQVRRGVGSDVRIGKHFLFAGVGYGGSCFPKDVKALVQTGVDLGVPMTILDAAERVNEEQKKLLFDKILAHFGGSVAGRHLAVWGLAFKPNTDDMREAPALVLIDALLAAGATVCAYDPVAMEAARRIVGDRIRFATNYYDAIEGADAVALVTEWNEFRMPDYDKMKELMREPTVFDGRNIYSPDRMRQLGFAYYSIGRK